MAYKLLFVCLGNICRFPAAENIMRHQVQQAGLSKEIICDSAGMIDKNIGKSPDPRMIDAAAARGIKLQGQARQFHQQDFENYDLILAMDRDNYWSLISLDPYRKYREKIQMMCDYSRRYWETEVPDPYEGGQEGFNHVINLLLDACEGLLDSIKYTEKN